MAITKTYDLLNINGVKGWVRDSWARRAIAALQASVPSASTASPAMDGTASAGSSTEWARGDHVHPHDTSKQDALTATQMEAVNSGITADYLAVNDPTVLCDVTTITPILSAGTHYSGYGNCYYYKVGSRVTVHIGLSGITASTRTIVFFLPTGYLPKSIAVSSGIGANIQYRSTVQVGSSGAVTVWSESTYALSEISFDAFG